MRGHAGSTWQSLQCGPWELACPDSSGVFGPGLGANELYVVKSGEFEVLERRQGINMRVNRKARGDCFGEVSLMYSCPRSATVAAMQDSVVWVLERQLFRCCKHSCCLCLPPAGMLEGLSSVGLMHAASKS